MFDPGSGPGQFGGDCPAEFKAVVAAAPALRARLEGALRAKVGWAARRGRWILPEVGVGADPVSRQAASAQAAQQKAASAVTAAPKIQLKMDFSAFKA